jgi:ubiquitin carboxyl-terminal hydrolase 36/42
VLTHLGPQEVLEGADAYRCDKCKQLSAATKRITIDNSMPPNVLVLHLKRFKSGGYGKVNTHVAFHVRVASALACRPAALMFHQPIFRSAFHWTAS